MADHNPQSPPQPRMATVHDIIKDFLPNFLPQDKIPSPRALTNWLNRARVARFKSNPTAKRGGGVVFYSLSGVEKFFRNRTAPKS